MIGFKKSMIISLAVGGMLLGGAAPSGAAEVDVEPQHVITCEWDSGVGTPWSVDADTVKGFVRVKCSDSLDNANTQAQIQYLYGYEWRDKGVENVSYSTAKTIHVNDSTTKVEGRWLYRTKGQHYGQHGNIWALPTYYSPSRYLTRS